MSQSAHPRVRSSVIPVEPAFEAGSSEARPEVLDFPSARLVDFRDQFLKGADPRLQFVV